MEWAPLDQKEEEDPESWGEGIKKTMSKQCPTDEPCQNSGELKHQINSIASTGNILILWLYKHDF